MNAPALRDAYDVAVVGAGPAGLAAATVTARAGLATVLLDEQPTPGGQIHRAITRTPLQRRAILGEDYWRGTSIVEAFLGSGAQYAPDAVVENVTPERGLRVALADGARAIRAERIVLATGALERPFPVPGWTLPGVMSAGAAQILLKTCGVVPGPPTVLAGCGPLLWLIAWQYLNANVPLAAILDTTPAANRSQSLSHVLPFMFSPYVAKGLQLLAQVKSRVRVLDGVTSLSAIGRECVEAVAFTRSGRREERLPATTLLLHQGVVPDVNLALLAGVEHRWDELQLCWKPVIDPFGRTARAGIAIVGDGAGVAGGPAAEQRGVLAAIAITRELSPRSALPDEAQARAMLGKFTTGRNFLDSLYQPARAFRLPVGDTIVCRCESITAQQIADKLASGCTTPEQLQSTLRCGTGACQGRMCGLTVTEIVAQARRIPAQQAGYLRLQPPAKRTAASQQR